MEIDPEVGLWGFQRLDVHSLRECGSLDRLWARTMSSCDGMLTEDWSVPTLRSGLDSVLGTVVVEPQYLCKDHRNLHSHFYSKKFVPGNSECVRLHFFNRADITDASFKDDPAAFREAYLGFCVVRPVALRNLGRTVLDPRKLGRGEFCLRTKFKAHLRGRELIVSGFPYMSQDTDATVCAHSALWATCRYMSERYPAYGEVHPYDLIEWTTTNRGRRVPHRGMTYEDYSTILSAFGAYPEVLRLHRRDGAQDLVQFQNLCAFVESGFPVIASLPSHAIVVVGHTLDFERQHHPAYEQAQADPLGLVDCAAYWKQFIVVDDNAFPYARFGFAGDTENYRCAMKPPVATVEDIHSAVIPLPEKAFLPVDVARERSREVLSLNEDLLRAARAGGAGPLVTRLFLTNGSSWKRRKIEAWKATPSDPLLSLAADFRLPHFVWVQQAAPFSLYRRGRCTAEIVLDATAGRNDTAALCGRIGNTVLFRGEARGGVTGRKQFSDAPAEWELYRHNLGEPT